LFLLTTVAKELVAQRNAEIDSTSTLPITVPGIYNEGNTCFMNR
jgi:hypothetical protein